MFSKILSHLFVRGFLKHTVRMGFEAAATLSRYEIGKYALNGIFCCKEFSDYFLLVVNAYFRDK